MVLNKVDVPDGRDLADIVLPDFEARGLHGLQVSAASHEGLRELSFAMAEIVAAEPRRQARRRGDPDRDPSAHAGTGDRVHRQADR